MRQVARTSHQTLQYSVWQMGPENINAACITIQGFVWIKKLSRIYLKSLFYVRPNQIRLFKGFSKASTNKKSNSLHKKISKPRNQQYFAFLRILSSFNIPTYIKTKPEPEPNICFDFFYCCGKNKLKTSLCMV